MAKSEQIAYHVTDLISEQVSDFRFGRQRYPEKATFLPSEKALLVPETKPWDLFWNQVCDVVAWYEICSLSAIGKWSSQDCDVVSNLVDEIAIYNFDLFHSTLLYVGAHYTRKNSEAVIHKILSHICLMHNSSQPGQPAWPDTFVPFRFWYYKTFDVETMIEWT